MKKGKEKSDRPRNGKKALTIAIIIIAIVLLLIFLLVNFITDWLWFAELGYVSVFLKQIVTELEIGVPLFIVLLFLSLIYLKILKKGYYKKVESNDMTGEKKINGAAWLLSLILAGGGAVMISTMVWFEALKYTNSTGFSIADPLFNNDISFYVFKLAFIQQLNEAIIGLVIGFAAITAVFYMIMVACRKPQIFEDVDAEEYEEEAQTGRAQQNAFGDAFGKFGKAFGGAAGGSNPFGGIFGGTQQQAPKKPKKQLDSENFMELINIASKQIIALGVIFFIMIAVDFFLKQYNLLYSTTGVVFGAGFTDTNITLWMYRILVVLSLVSAVTFAIGMARKKFKSILYVPVIMILVGALGAGVGYVVQNWVVSPDEITKESKYLEYNIQYTQYAYDLSKVKTVMFAADENLSVGDIENNMETISNIRINDYEPAQKFYNQTESIRQYYIFNDVDVDRYMINGEYTQTYLSAREIDEAQIRTEWLNQHIKYTHGYGITLSRVDSVTETGQPEVLIGDIPPVSAVDEIAIDRPEIYFGEKTDNYILVGTDEQEFDYPNGDSNTYATYEGNAGIKLGLMNRILFSIREQDVKLFMSSNISSNSKIILYRNVADRVQKIMPMLSYDSDPYIVTADGKLYWIMDAYTTSSYYPYSEPYASGSNYNYLRNSIKVVIDAYNGDVSYYLVDDSDPIATTLKEIYPALFKDFEEMPENLQSHIRYPNTMLNIQANVYARYHMSDVNVFYQGEDMWQIAHEIYGIEEKSMEPNYYIYKLPGEKDAEFVNSIAYTPKDKKNMTALLVARNDGENYGDLVIYQFPKSKVVYGPMQIEAMIDQNTEISKEFSLWNSAGSTYTRGNLFVIPIEDSILYVEPVYLEAQNSSIPEVKRVIVVYGDTIAYEATLTEALESLFGHLSASEEEIVTGDDGQEVVVGEDDTTVLSQIELIQLANDAFNNAVAAQQSGDWASYGKYQKELQNYLTQLAQ